MRRTLLLSALIAAVGCDKSTTETTDPVAATEVEAKPTSPAIPLDPSIRTGTLDNGLTYFIRQNPKPEKRAALWLAVDAGSVLEDDDQQGLAHFVEHMAFNGTERFEKNTLIDFIEKAGMDFGADLNAFTSFDETVYMLTVPTDDEATLTMGFDILEDWSSALTFDPAEVDKERGVVTEEWRLGRGAGQRAFDKQQPVFLAGSKYADRKPIGKKEILQDAPVEALSRFYEDWYRPDLMAVIVVGDVDPDAMEEEIKKRFSDLENPENARERENVAVPLEEKTRVSVVADDEQNFSTLSLAIKGPLTPVVYEDDVRGELVEMLFHSMLNDRMQELGRKPDAPFMFAFGSTSPMGRTVDVFRLWAGVKPGKLDAVLQTMITEVERVRQHGFLETELQRQRVALVRQMERQVAEEEKSKSRGFAFEIMRHFLSDEALPSRTWRLERVKQLLPTVTLEEVNAVATEWTSRKDRVVLATGATRDALPEEAALAKRVESMADLKVEPYIDEVSTTPLMANAPTAGTITEKKTIEAIGTHVWTLSNGAKVVVKPTDFKNDEIQFSAFSPGGSSLAKSKQYDAIRSASSMVRAGGLGEHSTTQLDKMSAGKIARVNAWFTELEETVNGFASPQDLEYMLQMTHLAFTQPRKDLEAVAAWKQTQAAWIKNRDLNPQSVFGEEMNRVVTGDHPRRRWQTVEGLEKVDLEASFDFYAERFGDASDFTFVFVGNVDLGELEKLSATYLASLPGEGRKEKWKDLKIKPPKGVKKVSVVKGMDPKSSVQLMFHGTAEWSAEAEDDLEQLAATLEIRLREVLREQMGGVYGAYSWGSFERRPVERYQYRIGFGCAPENVDKLVEAVHTEIAAAKKSGASDEIVEKIRENRRRQLEENVEENRWWMRKLTDAFRYGDDPSTLLDDAKERVERVSSSSVKKAAKRYLKKQYVLGVLKPDPEELAKNEGADESKPAAEAPPSK